MCRGKTEPTREGGAVPGTHWGLRTCLSGVRETPNVCTPHTGQDEARASEEGTGQQDGEAGGHRWPRTRPGIQRPGTGPRVLTLPTLSGALGPRAAAAGPQGLSCHGVGVPRQRVGLGMWGGGPVPHGGQERAPGPCREAQEAPGRSIPGLEPGNRLCHLQASVCEQKDEGSHFGTRGAT